MWKTSIFSSVKIHTAWSLQQFTMLDHILRTVCEQHIMYASCVFVLQYYTFSDTYISGVMSTNGFHKKCEATFLHKLRSNAMCNSFGHVHSDFPTCAYLSHDASFLCNIATIYILSDISCSGSVIGIKNSQIKCTTVSSNKIETKIFHTTNHCSLFLILVVSSHSHLLCALRFLHPFQSPFYLYFLIWTPFLAF